MLDALAGAPLNHLLRANDWAREALSAHAGKVACFRCLPFETRLVILDSGEVRPAPAGSEPALTLTLTPGLMLRAAARDDSIWRDVQSEGDTALAATIHQLWRHLRWDAEEDLSRLIGDAPAHTVANIGRSVAQALRSFVSKLPGQDKAGR